MATQYDPIAKDESLNTTETPSRNIADVLAEELAGIASALSPSQLNDLSDVTITTASNGQVLTYDSVSGKWVNANPSGGSGGHTIWNRIKTALTARSNLWFADAKTSDESTDDATKVEVLTELADETAFDNLPTDGTSDGMYAFPDSGAEYLTPQMVGFNSISFTANTQGNGSIELPGTIQSKVVVGFQITSIPSGYGEAGGWLLKSTNGKYYFMCKDASGSAVANKQVGITFFYY